MKKSPSFLVVALFYAISFNMNLMAKVVPTPSKFDNRITFATYNANDVFEIHAKNGYVSVLEFGEKEIIENIATGFIDGWELIDRDNYLFIKPKAYVIKTEEQNFKTESGDEITFSSVIQPTEKDWKTNLIVTTNKRFYSFDLILSGEENNKINYKVEFRYPQDIASAKNAQKIAKERELKEKKEQANLENELNRVNVPRNWDFVMHINKGSDTIAPDYAYDDGVFTYFGFNNTKTIPSVFLFDEANEESILNTHIEKNDNYDVLVVHKTAKKILLRSGKKLVGILNNGYAKNPIDRTYTTKNKAVVREIIEDE